MMKLGGKCVCKNKISSPITKYRDLNPALCLELRKIVEQLISPGKGILASDESPESIENRFADLGITNTETTRRDYRQMLFSADKSQLSQYLSGVILHHETVYQKTTDGIEFPEFLRQRNLIPGVKVDRGLVRLFGTQDESTTQGLDNLQERCVQYKKDGCHFTKWRCTFVISETTPSWLAMVTNAHVLARFASICQSARMVPIVEPEILTVGEHGINKALQVHEEVLSILFHTLNEHRVYLEGMILKSAMVLPGMTVTSNCKPQIIAEHTLQALARTVPLAVPAIVFLSGGQSDEDAIVNLNAINACKAKEPWHLTFCYGRALQNDAMKIWRGSEKNEKEAQAALIEKARMCSEASLGELKLDGFSTCTRNLKEMA